MSSQIALFKSEIVHTPISMASPGEGHLVVSRKFSYQSGNSQRMNTYDKSPTASPSENLYSMAEEDEGESSSQQESAEWTSQDEETRSSSPSASIHSGHSSPSEVGGDSGVCSEHDTPPLRLRKPLQKRATVSSDSDNDSSASSESFQDINRKSPIPLGIPSEETTLGQLRKRSSRIVNSKTKLPCCLLKEIKEKSRELKKKRQRGENNNNGERSQLARTTSYQRSGRMSRLPSPINNLHNDVSCLSLADSSNYSSTTSLYTEDDDIYPPPTFSDSARPLFECRDKTASYGFAGLSDIFAPQQESTIKSSKGTVRGVKNRVRAGIATFMSDQRFLKLYAKRERGKIVVYSTTLGIVRETYERCLRLRKILWTLLVHFEERDVFMSRDIQIQLLDRLHARAISVPHVFLEGQYLGGVELIERLNETGELRRLLQPYMRPASTTPCDTCGGFRLLPCTVCCGSKKSVHRNNFTLEFVALKCSACDESGLVYCHDCVDTVDDP